MRQSSVPSSLHQWYSGIAIPRFSKTVEIENFAANITGLAVSFISDKLKHKPSVYFSPDIETAAIDITTNTIYISTAYINPNPAKRVNPKVTDEVETLTAMIGSTIHELFHIKHTTKTVEEACAIASISNDIFSTIFNVVEDLFIDADALKVIGQLRFAYVSRVNYLFPVEKAKSMAVNVPDQIETLFDLVDVVDLCIMLKNFENFELREYAYESKVFVSARKMFLKAATTKDIFERIKLSVEIYNFLISTLPQEERQKLDSMGQDDSKGEDGQPDGDASGLSDGESSAITEMLRNAQNIENASKIQQIKGRIDKDSVNFTTQKTKHGELAVLMVDAQPDVFRSLSFDTTRNFSKIVVDERFVDFASLIKARSIVNHPYGAAADKGRNMRRLYRIATDSKIFSDPQKVSYLGKQEIIILVDLSGSMRQHKKMENALQVAWGAAMGLEEGRHNVAVYGHSADLQVVTGNCDVLLVKLKGFDEPAQILDERCQTVSEFSEDIMSSNADDVAIQNVVKAFSGAQNSKTLIVISDGMPSAACSSGINGTKDAVDAVREKGIKVLSISIEPSAVDKNNIIYGSDFNYDSSDPGIVFKIIESM